MTEGAIAGGVPVRVVEDLEVVQVGEGDGIGNLLIVQAAQRLFHAASIQLAGERVGGGGNFAGDQGPEKAEAGSCL